MTCGSPTLSSSPRRWREKKEEEKKKKKKKILFQKKELKNYSRFQCDTHNAFVNKYGKLLYCIIIIIIMHIEFGCG